MKTITSLAAFATLLLSGAEARAHIDLESHESRPGGDQKASPCEGTGRGSNVYTYRPGATINITVNETIGHPGYFRIAFDAEGEDDFVIPSGTDGVDGNCGGDSACGPGKEDYCNSPAVMWDHLDQHFAGFLSGGTYTWSITLPDVECENCTLQVIQMMNDLDIHTAPYPEDDIYYRCIDLVLSEDAPEVEDAPVTNNGMQCDTFDATATGGTPVDPGGMTGDGGVTTGGATDGGMPDPGSTTGGGTTGGTDATTAGSTAGATTTGGTTGGADTGGTTMPATGGTVVDTTGGAVTTTADTTTGAAAPTTDSSAGPAAPATTSDGGGCSAARSGQQAGAWLSMLLVGSAVVLRRRRRFASPHD